MKTRSHPWISLGIGLTVGLALIGAMIWRAGFREVRDAICSASLAWLGMAVAVYVLSWILRTWRLQSLVRFFRADITWSDIFKVHIAAYALNNLLPAKLGDVAMVGFLKAKAMILSKAAAVVFQTRVLDAMALVAVCSVNCVLLFRTDTPGWIVTTIVVALLVATLPLALVFLDGKGRLIRLLTGLVARAGGAGFHMMQAKVMRVHSAYRAMTLSPRLALTSLCQSVGIWLTDALVCSAVAHAIHAPVSVGMTILAVCVANLGKSAPTTPGGIGIYEGLLSGCLSLGGLAYPSAIAVAILDHTIKKGFNLIVGLPAAAALGPSMKGLADLIRGRTVQDMPVSGHTGTPGTAEVD